MTRKSNQWVNNKRKLLIEDFGGKCIICSNDENLEFHHKKPTNLKGFNRGSWQRLNDIINHLDCYVLVCYYCHREIHSNLGLIHKLFRKD